MTPQTSIDPIDALEASRRHFEATIQDLSDNEALERPSAERWSVIDCIEHICITESLGLKRLQSAEVAPEPSVNPEKEAAMAAQVENRDAKVQGPPVAMPTGRFATLSEALAEFRATRERTIEFVRDCPSLAALRVHHPVFRQLTGREYALLIAGHCRRHAAQIAEIRATSAKSHG
jgi:hypothetical protein